MRWWFGSWFGMLRDGFGVFWIERRELGRAAIGSCLLLLSLQLERLADDIFHFILS